MREINVAVVGATGLVGQTLFKILEEQDFPVKAIFPLASARSKGKSITFKGNTYEVEDLAEFDFSKVELAFFSAGGEVSKIYAPKAAQAGCMVIDNTSTFRLDDDIPLVVPEVNAHCIKNAKSNIIANPNCSTIQMLVALNPIHQVANIKRINVATYQAVSGAGKRAVTELEQQVVGSDVCEVFPVPIAYNAIAQIDVFQENGYTKEEMKMVLETKKILESPDIKVNPTCVRIPVKTGHSEAIHIETQHKITADEALQLLKQSPGIEVIDERKPSGYPSPLCHAQNTNSVFVGRVREDISHPNGLNLWVVSDNIRKGAALNSVQIAKVWLETLA